MKKILFVNPAYKDDVLWRLLKVPPLGLATLAAHTPEKYDVTIVDECIEDIDYSQKADLVAISSITKTAPRAYEIALGFQKRGIPVVIGGIHASMIPEEALKYCNSVIIGEAESVWKQVLGDFERNSLKPYYRGDRDLAVNNPRRDLLSDKYSVQMVQTSRGCPFNCEFCSVTKFNGGNHRHRPIDEVVSEVSGLGKGTVFFCDDNIIGVGRESEQRFISLFNQLKDHGRRWFGQASINVANNGKVLKTAAESGCVGLLIGMESINESTLKQMNKGNNLKYGVTNYKEAIKKIHDVGISINGTFVIGNDTDDKETILRLIDFINDSGLDRAQITISTPFPGTRLYSRLKEEGRLLYTDYPYDWKKYDCSTVVFRPKNMSIEELSYAFNHIYEETTSFVPSIKRSMKSLQNTKNLMGSVASFLYNWKINSAVSSLNMRRFNSNLNNQA